MEIKVEDFESEASQDIQSRLSQDIDSRFGERKPGVMNIIARENGMPLGGIRAQAHWGWVYIGQVWVEKDQRKKGLLRSMMQELIATSKSRGFRGLYIDTFEEPVAQIYEKLGFKRFGEIEDFPQGYGCRIYLKYHF